MPHAQVDTAMVLAAGYGERMRPLTDIIPKPLVPFSGKPLIDHVLDRLARAGVQRAVVNGHYLADKLFAYLSTRKNSPEIILSDETAELLDTGGGVVFALEKLGRNPFLTHNSDTVWIETKETCNLMQLIARWDDTTMDCVLLLADLDRALGYDGAGDFVFNDDAGRLRRRTPTDKNALVYAGVSVIHPRLFATAPKGAFSMNVIWDQAIARGRVFGLTLDGTWMHIGTPEALYAAERWIKDDSARSV